jgi:minichromosome maintenance protein 10
VTNVLGITPESAESALVLGYARDLGICTVQRKDGKPCGSWTDKRTSEVCEYHVQTAVQRRRAGRAEFSTGYGHSFPTVDLISA